MGVVRRQTIKNNLLAYVGVAIGVLSQLYIYPDNLEAKGFADGLMRFAALIYPFLTLGVGAVMVRFLPYMRTERGAAMARMLTWSLVIVSATLVSLIALTYFFGDGVIKFLGGRDYQLGLLETHRWSIIFITVCLTYAGILTTNLINYRRIAVPVVFNNLVLKVTLPVLVLLVSYDIISTAGFLLGILGSYVLVVGGLLAYSRFIGALRLDTGPMELTEKGRGDMVSVAGFALFGLLGSSLVTNTDVVMVNTVLSNKETAIYTFCLFAAGVMAIPYAAVNTITAPLVAERWQAGERDALGKLYRESSIALTAVGLLVITGLAVCLPYLYYVTDKMIQHQPGYWPTLLIAAGLLTDLATGINSTLINYSDHYRWHIVFVLSAGLLNYGLNYYFLVVLQSGIVGAATATMLSLVGYNLAKSIFVWRRIGIQPIGRDHLVLFAVFAAVGTLAWLLPESGISYLEILVRGGCIVIGAFLVFRFTDASGFLRQALRDGLKAVF